MKFIPKKEKRLLHFPPADSILVALRGVYFLVFETIRSFLVQQLAVDEERIHPSTVILQDLEAEPSDLAELMLMLEQEFGIEWTDSDLKNIETVGDLISFIENHTEI